MDLQSGSSSAQERLIGFISICVSTASKFNHLPQIFIDAANKMPFLSPEDSKTEGESSAAPKIWKDMPDFKARFQKLGTDDKAAVESISDFDSFKGAWHCNQGLRRLR
jgi:cytochrome c556